MRRAWDLAGPWVWFACVVTAFLMSIVFVRAGAVYSALAMAWCSGLTGSVNVKLTLDWWARRQGQKAITEVVQNDGPA